MNGLKRLLAFSARYIQGISLAQLPSHMELDIIFDGLGKCVSCLIVTENMSILGYDSPPYYEHDGSRLLSVRLPCSAHLG